MEEKREIKTIKADKYYHKQEGIYKFPFEVLDKTPGGSNLGRIEWCIEPIRGRKTKGRYYIEKLLVWAKQTRDKRYAGKLFEISCFAESITASCLKKEDSFIGNVWCISFCADHKMPWLEAYPRDYHSVLKISVGSSISIDADFN